jgi:glycosyltransferase involved in cell wall biosynthesis
MHLSFLTSEYPHPKVNKAAGIATSIKNLVHGLVAKGVSVSLFIYNQEEDAVFTEDGIIFHLIRKKSYPYFGFYLYRKLLEKYINQQIVKNAIDAIEAPDWTGITAFMKLKIPLVIRFHGSDTYFCQLENRKQKWKNRFFEKNAIKNATAYIAPTTFAGTKSAELFGINMSKVTTIHYGLNLEHFQNDKPNQFVAHRLLNIGTIIRKKGVFHLAEVFNILADKYEDAKLILIGGDSYDVSTGSDSTWELVKEVLSDKAKTKVNYLGKVPYETVKEHIKQAHVCVFPSLAETLGMVTIESMALQKAVVNTSYGWARELIDHDENGYLIDPKDEKQCAQTISALFDDREKTIQIGQKARRKIENTFDINKIVEKNIAFYKTIIAP